MEDAIVSLSGPVERDGEGLFLLIPLEVGGDRLVSAAQGISRIHQGCLRIDVPDWLAEKLDIAEGSQVTVDNRDEKLNIIREE